MHESSECSIQAGMCGLKTHVVKIKVKHLSVAVFTTVGNYLCAFRAAESPISIFFLHIST